MNRSVNGVDGGVARLWKIVFKIFTRKVTSHSKQDDEQTVIRRVEDKPWHITIWLQGLVRILALSS